MMHSPFALIASFIQLWMRNHCNV